MSTPGLPDFPAPPKHMQERAQAERDRRRACHGNWHACEQEHVIGGTCTIEDAHCADCGAREFEISEVHGGPVCADCGGDIINPDNCKGEHS